LPRLYSSCVSLEPDEVVLGGGNSKKLKKLPPNTRLADNDDAFIGGFRMWQEQEESPHRTGFSTQAGRR
jgi:hypothetical protein